MWASVVEMTLWSWLYPLIFVLFCFWNVVHANETTSTWNSTPSFLPSQVPSRVLCTFKFSSSLGRCFFFFFVSTPEKNVSCFFSLFVTVTTFGSYLWLYFQWLLAINSFLELYIYMYMYVSYVYTYTYVYETNILCCQHFPPLSRDLKACRWLWWEL